MKTQIPAKSTNISDWYTQVILKSELADYGPAKGTMIIRPYGYAIWEQVQQAMDPQIKLRGVENAYFPLFIPESLLAKEKDHLQGFSPELAVVTIGGGKELAEKLIVRPTSETIMYEAYARWITSWRDLPLAINQWNNVVRWELRTYLFLRTTEFLWQEGHTAHSSHQEATDTVLWAMAMYKSIYTEYFALAGYVGRKSASERFAGALDTLTFESLMPDGKALQSCTSHDLGQNFSVPFNIKFQAKDGSQKHVWQTSWGFSTRSIGGLVLAHGDDNGLILPPKLAPIQVILLPVEPTPELVAYATTVLAALQKAGIRAKLDTSDTQSFGYKLNKWEVKGVPLRVELGSTELANQTVTVSSRVTLKKTTMPITEFLTQVQNLLDEVQASLLTVSQEFLSQNTHEVSAYADFKTIMETSRGFIKAFWCENPECEKKIKEETKATTRCLPLDSKEETGNCVYCGAPSKYKWLFAQAY